MRGYSEADRGAWKRDGGHVGGDLYMQIMDVQYSAFAPHPPTVLLHGVDQTGATTRVTVSGFLPYIYASLPDAVRAKRARDDDEGEVARLRRNLEGMLRGPELHAKERERPQLIVDCAVVRRRDIYGYNDYDDYLKITLASPRLVKPLCGVLSGMGLHLYDADIPYTTRFMVDRGLVGGGWMRVPASDLYRRANSRYHGQQAFETRAAAVVAVANDGEWARCAGLRTLSFDIECCTLEGKGFPASERDPVIQISAVWETLGGECEKAIFCYLETDPIADAAVFSYAGEAEMLLAFARFVRDLDPDIVTGYNIINFDFPYLFARAEALQIGEQFARLGRSDDWPARCVKKHTHTNQSGHRDTHDVQLHGRVVVDMLEYIRGAKKFASYKLNAVATALLGETKVDLDYKHIGPYWRESPAKRRTVAVYCVHDAVLPLRLMKKMMTVVNLVEMARVTGVTITDLVTRGQGVRTVSLLLRYARADDFIIPLRERSGEDEVGFQGATVIEPKIGFYTEPIATLDFASLYPSIMMAHNLCFSTLIRGPNNDVPLHQITVTPTGARFAKPDARRGLLPRILEDLVAARRVAKRDMEAEEDPFRRAVFDGRQLALKVVCNSVYGFTGASKGKLPCLEISSSVTAFGREMIDTTANLVREKYSVENGYAKDATIIYGDTDSVMVKFGVATVAESMQLGAEAAAYVSGHFLKPIKLEFEKVYDPYLLLCKKRYVGMYHTKPDKPDYMDTKGIESKRRDFCELVRRVQAAVLRALMIDRNVDAAVQIVIDAVRKLVRGEIGMYDLIITRSLKDSYKTAVPQALVAEKMKKRDPGTAPDVGDRVAFVILSGSKKDKMSDCAEDPLYALRNRLPISAKYYIESQLMGPIERVLSGVVSEQRLKQMWEGEHTRVVVDHAPMRGVMGRFFQPAAICVSCRARIAKPGLCPACEPRRFEIAAARRQAAIAARAEDARIDAHCRKCLGSDVDPHGCTAVTCKVFWERNESYERVKKAERDESLVPLVFED